MDTNVAGNNEADFLNFFLCHDTIVRKNATVRPAGTGVKSVKRGTRIW